MSNLMGKVGMLGYDELHPQNRYIVMSVYICASTVGNMSFVLLQRFLVRSIFAMEPSNNKNKKNQNQSKRQTKKTVKYYKSRHSI